MRPDGEPEFLSPIDPRALLRHALGRINAPDAEETDYRRAVSDAFYALYHALTLAAMPHMTDSDDPFEPYRQVRRIRHRHVRDAANATLANADERARMVADVLLRLYAAREDADYNHLVQFTRADVETLIRRAARAVEAVTAPGFGEQDLPRRLAAMLDAP